MLQAYPTRGTSPHSSPEWISSTLQPKKSRPTEALNLGPFDYI